MKARKTIDVLPFTRKLQQAIELTDSDEKREALSWVLSEVLFDSDNYRGYSHFDRDGKLTTKGCMVGEENYNRRRYYLPKP